MGRADGAIDVGAAEGEIVVGVAEGSEGAKVEMGVGMIEEGVADGPKVGSMDGVADGSAVGGVDGK